VILTLVFARKAKNLYILGVMQKMNQIKGRCLLDTVVAAVRGEELRPVLPSRSLHLGFFLTVLGFDFRASCLVGRCHQVG
jgi:hypothetical protein